MMEINFINLYKVFLSTIQKLITRNPLPSTLYNKGDNNYVI